MDSSQRTTLPGSTPVPSSLDRETWGTLRLLSLAGTGSFGCVYRAWDTELERHVAVKLLPRSHPEGVLQEARALARVRHPGVVTVFDAGVFDGIPGFAMELIDGVTLATELRERGRLAPRELSRAGSELAAALAAIHAAGLLHRDLKPSNVMRRQDGSLVIMDLGAGRSRHAADAAQAGTLLYMAPETLAGGGTSPRTDLYSLGALLYELAVGHPPHAAHSREELLAAHRQRKAEPVAQLRPDLPPALATAIDDAVAHDPARRPVSAAAFAERLDGVAIRTTRRRSRWAVAATVALVLAGAAIWFGFRGDGAAPVRPLRAGVSYLAYENGIARTLSGGDEIDSRQQLGLEITLGQTAHVYVVNEDGRGRVTVMYPVEGSRTGGPLRGGRSHYLPGITRDGRLGWTFDSERGSESIMVVVSRTRLDEFERMLAALPAVDTGGGVVVRSADANTVAALARGVSGVANVRPAEASGPVDDLATLATLATPAGAAPADQVWVHLMQLRNSGR